MHVHVCVDVCMGVCVCMRLDSGCGCGFNLVVSVGVGVYPLLTGDKWPLEWGVNIRANLPKFRGILRKRPYF